MKMMMKSLALLFSAAAMLSTTGCVSVFAPFDHNDKYTPGDFVTESTVNALDIDWVSGSVKVTHHDQPEVTVTEICNASLKDSQKLQTWLDGTTLHIRFCKPGLSFQLGSAKKNLEIRLPDGLELDTLECDCTSADTSFTDISAGSIHADITSGKLQLIGCSAEAFEISSASGDITVEQKGNTDILKAESTSGKINIKAESDRELRAHTTSGSITIEQKGTTDLLHAVSTSGKINITAETVGELKTHTTSGDVNVTAQKTDSVISSSVSGAETMHFSAMPASADINATSGRISLFVPKNADFRASVNTVSGGFDSDLSLTKNGKTYTAGSGENQLKIDTTSGSVVIKAET